MFVLLSLDELSLSIMIKFTYPKRRFVEVDTERRREGKEEEKKNNRAPLFPPGLPHAMPCYNIIMNRILVCRDIFTILPFVR